MDASNPNATTPAEFQGGTATFRTDLYATGATLLTHKESIELHRQTRQQVHAGAEGPEPRRQTAGGVRVRQPGGYAQAMIDDYKAAGIPPRKVWAQSFNQDDVLYWIRNEPAFGKQAVYLDDANVPADVPSAEDLKGYARQGIRIVAPPMWVLLDVRNGRIVPSQYARNAKAAGLDIITWTLERSGRIVEEVLPTKGTAAPPSTTNPRWTLSTTMAT